MTKLILLSMLDKKDLYGYEINQILREKYSHFTHVSFSSIYYTLDRMQELGFITKREKKVGNRPVRHVFHITPAGRKEYEKLLQKKVRKEGTRIHHQEPFNLPFSLMGRLPQAEVKSILEQRLGIVKEKKVNYRCGKGLISYSMPVHRFWKSVSLRHGMFTMSRSLVPVWLRVLVRLKALSA